MKHFLFFIITLMGYGIPVFSQQPAGAVSLFNGKTFKGWEGDTLHTWRIENNSLVGGSLKDTVPHNEFLCTAESFNDFELTLQFKLVGTGFVNAGVQFHSQRATNPSYEMIGYQADLGKGYWASLYDESRRNLTLVKPTDDLINKVLKPGEWNDYKIRSQGKRIQIWLNGIQTVDYTETDENIPHKGLIALQVHGGGKVEASYRNIRIAKF
jgi:hypothetical protein